MGRFIFLAELSLELYLHNCLTADLLQFLKVKQFSLANRINSLSSL